MSDTVNTAEIRIVADSSGVEAGLRQATEAANRADRAISGIGAGAERSQRNLIQAIQRTTAAMEAGSTTGSRYYEIIARQRGVDPAILEPYLRQLRAVEEAQRSAAEGATETSGRMERAFAALRGGAIVAAVAAMVAPVISAQREFDKLNASLVTATGSTEKAAVAFAALQTFAATTPFGLAESTEAFIKMRNLGLDPSERALRSYGNTAAAMGKSLEQMVEAVADAATGEFERLKEFGIKASQNGEKVTLTFKGTSTTIKNEAQEIEKYLTKLGEVDFAGAMVQRAATLDGAISQLGDSWDSFLRTVSSGGIGDAARDGVDVLSTAFSNLETILKSVSDAADKQNDSLLSLDTVNKAITVGLEAVTVLGVNTAYVFTQIRNEFVGLGKQAYAVATGDFTKARAIGEQMKAAAERDRAEVDRQTAAILGAVEKAKKVAESAPKKGPNDDALSQFQIQREAERESAESAKRRAEQIKRETAALAELAGLTTTFAADWKMLSKLYADGKINLEGLTKAQADLLAKQPAMKAAAEQGAKARKESEEFTERYMKALAATSDIYDQRIADAKEEAERNEELARTFGLTKTAIEQLEIARLEEQLAQRASLGLTLEEIKYLEDLIAAKRRSAAALGELEVKEANKKAADQAVKDWERSSEQIGQSLADNIMRGGKSAADYIEDLFRTMVLKPVVQAIVQPVANQITGMMGGGQQGSNASIYTGLASLGSKVYQGYQAGGISGAFSGLFSGGSSASAGAGAGAGVGGASAGYAIPIAGWIAAGAALSRSLYKQGWDMNNGTVKDPLKLGSSFDALDSVFRKIGLSNSVAAMLSGQSTFARLFGRKNPEIESQGLQGTITAGGFDGNAYANILEKGGVFRSDKRYTQTAALGADQDKSLDESVKAIIEAAKGFASTLGLEASVIEGYNKQIKLELGKDEAKNQEAIAKLFGEIGDDLSTRLVPSIKEFSAAGETASATLQRLVTNYATVDEALKSIGTQFGAVGVASLSARERLIEASGGLEAFAANTAGFQQNFLTESERLAPVMKSVTEQLASMGLSSVDTRKEFQQVVLGLDLTTEAGAKQYGQLMKLQAAFALVYPEMEDTAAAAKAAADALAATNKGYQDQIDELLRARMSPEERRASDIAGMDASTIALYDRVAALQAEAAAIERAKVVADERLTLQNELDDLTLSAADKLKKQRDALDGSNRAIFDQIQAVKAQQTASQEAAAAIKAAAESSRVAVQSFGNAIVDAMNRATASAKSMREFADSLKLGGLSTLDPDARYREAKKQFEAADPSNTAAAQAFLQASKDRGADSFYYERDFALVQDKLLKGAKALDDYAARLPDFYRGAVQAMTAPVITPPVAPPVVQQSGTMSKESASQANSGLEQRMDKMIDRLGKLEAIAESTSKTAEYIDRVTEGGNAMVVAN